MPRFNALTFLLSLATLSATAFGQRATPVSPGTLNYVEGQASIEGRALTPHSVGNTMLEAGQVLATANGKAEILLTPGIFLRLGDDSTVQMVSTDLTHTEVKLEQGQANVEVDQIYPQNTILVDLKNGQTQLLKNGLYAFDAANSTVRVFDGKAAVYPGANTQPNVKPIDVKGGHQLVLNGEPLKPQGFNKDQAKADPLYKWSSLRSNYLGEANLNLAEEYAGYSGFYPGWYWAGGPFGYTWLPGDGLFWSPFGYGFYSPYYIRGGGFIYGGYGRGFYGRGGYAGGYRGGVARAEGGGFHGGGGGGGGFHGGGGAGGHR
jgi:FecR protein